MLNLIKISGNVFHEILYLTWVRRKHDWLISSNIQLRNHQFQLILVKSAILVKKSINSTYYSGKKSSIPANIQIRNRWFWLILVKPAILVKKSIDSIYYSDKKSSISANISETCYSNKEINQFHLLKSATQLRNQSIPSNIQVRNRRFQLILVKPAILVKELIDSLVRIADFDQPA